MFRMLYRLLLICLLSGTLTACQSIKKNPSEIPPLQTEESSLEEVDQAVTFSEETALLQLPEKEKAKRYQELDRITLTTRPETISPLDYSHIQAIPDQASYQALLKASHRDAQLIYIGFDNCPYCRAFLPKLNQLAKELKLTYHYYNTDEREQDANFRQVVDEFFKVSTVPQLFIIKDEKVYNHLENYNSMQELENFLRQASQ